MFYIFHGKDELARSERLAEMLAHMGDPAMAELNTTYLDGQGLTLGQLREACDALPLFAERRVVIVTNYLSRFRVKTKNGEDDETSGETRKSSSQDELLATLADYLTKLPDSIRLFFLEDETLPARHPILAVANKIDAGFVQRFDIPQKRDLADWVVQRVKHRGALIEKSAAVALGEAIGPDLRLIDAEIEKLITFIGGDSPMIKQHHLEIVPYSGEANIYTMVDDIGRRNSRGALRMLHRLLDDGPRDEWLRLMGMIFRQFRILIQVKELSGQGLASNTIANKAGLHPFVAEKAVAQSKNFSMSQLEAIYRRLLQTDLDIKTGKMEPLLALDTLVAVLCGPPD